MFVVLNLTDQISFNEDDNAMNKSRGEKNDGVNENPFSNISRNMAYFFANYYLSN